MIVQATKMGYYGHLRRRPGDKFELKSVKEKSGKVLSAEDQFSKLWMKKLNEKQAAQYQAEREEKFEEDGDDSQSGANDNAEAIALAAHAESKAAAPAKEIKLTPAQKSAATKAAKAAKAAAKKEQITDSADA